MLLQQKKVELEIPTFFPIDKIAPFRTINLKTVSPPIGFALLDEFALKFSPIEILPLLEM
jgi:hypothetical protein